MATSILQITKWATILSAAILMISSCKKQTVILVPKACFIANKALVDKGDSIVFTNCSVANDVFIFFPIQGTETTFAGNSYRFNTSNSYTHVFNQSGIYTATVQASNNEPGSPIIFEKTTITVN